MERWDALCPGGLHICWDETAHKPGTDSFLLGSFPRLKPGLRVCDLGSGTGLLGLLLLQRQRELRVTGLELSGDAAALADRAAAKNGLTDRLRTLRGDLREAERFLPAGSFDLCVSNPPYFPLGGGAEAGSAVRRSARSETDCTLADVCRAAARALRWGGRLCMVHRPERLSALFCAMTAHGIEPKRLRLVQYKAGYAPNLVLVEGRRGGKPGLNIEKPLILCRDDGADSDEVREIYHRG